MVAPSAIQAATFWRWASSKFISFQQLHGLRNPIVALRFEFERELLFAGLHDAAIVKHVDKIGNDKIQQPLIMRDDQLRAVGSFQLVDAAGDNAQRVNVRSE